MANEKNLKRLSTSKAREIGKKGGKASVKAKQERKTLKEELLALLSQGNTQNRMSLALIEKAMNGDTKAFEVIRDSIGEKQIEKQQVENSGTQIIEIKIAEEMKEWGG